MESTLNQSIPHLELETRLSKFQKVMQNQGIGGALIIQKTDLFYFTSTSQQGWLYIPDSGDPLLMVFKEFERAKAESSWERIVSTVSPKKIPQTLTDHGYKHPVKLGMELDVIPANLYFQFSEIFYESSIVDISTDIRLIRAIKSDYEVSLIRKAAALSDLIAAKVPELLEPGKTEVGLAGEIEAYARSLGHQGIVRMRLFGSELFYGHLLSGPAAAVSSYLASPTGGQGVSPAIGQGPGFKKIAKNEPILFDYVFTYQGYLSDHARIYSVGPLPDELMRAHQAMLDIQEETKKMIKPGVLSGDVYDMMVSMAVDKGYEKYFMGVGDRKIRFTGHGIGLELDEFPFLALGQKLPLSSGMVIALEPKVILPGKGVVGIENPFLLTDSGLECLSNFNDRITILPG